MIIVKTFFLIYLIIIIIQFVFTKYFFKPKNNETDEINYNNKNKDKLKSIFTNLLNKYSQILETGNISTDDWFNLVQKNSNVEIDNYSYYTFIVEKVPNVDFFLYKVYPIKEYINLGVDNIADTLNQEIENNANDIQKGFASYTYGTALQLKNKISRTEYIWINQFNKNNVIKNSFIKYWKSPDSNRQGYIGIGYDLVNLTESTSYKYIDKINKGKLILISLIIFFITLVIFILKTKYYLIKCFIFLFISNLYIFHFINTKESLSTIENERKKIANIDSNILNVAFLSGINIFILKMIYTDLDPSNKKLFTETAIVFSVSIISLLLASYKGTDINRVEITVANRINTQMIFNIAIGFNLLIIINFIIYSFLTRSKHTDVKFL